MILDRWVVGMSTAGSVHASIAAQLDSVNWAAIRVQGVQLYTLTVATTAGGHVLLPGEGTYEYSQGDMVPLQAQANSGYQFVQWDGDISAIADRYAPVTTITMNGDYAITAVFQLITTDVGSIKGHVIDKETGNPILGASVYSGEYFTATDAQGYYEIRDIPVGTYEFTYSATGYMIATRTATIAKDAWAIIDVALTPGEGPEPKPPQLSWKWIGLGIGATLALLIATRGKFKKGTK